MQHFGPKVGQFASRLAVLGTLDGYPKKLPLGVESVGPEVPPGPHLDGNGIPRKAPLLFDNPAKGDVPVRRPPRIAPARELDAFEGPPFVQLQVQFQRLGAD